METPSSPAATDSSPWGLARLRAAWRRLRHPDARSSNRSPAPQKILGIGLSRTGTLSLAQALEILGYRTVHFPRSLAEIDASDAATDASVSFIYKELDRAYPGSKFVLTVRNKAEWLRSCEWHYGHGGNLATYDETTRQVAIALRTTLYDGIDFDATRFSRCYDRHVDDVRRYFADRPGDLLELNLCDGGDPWRALCTFLQRPLPRAPFPHGHARTDRLR